MAITIVTGNSHKCEQITHALNQHNIEAVCSNIDLQEIQSLDNKEVVSKKVLDAYAQLQQPVLVDDGGFFIHAYNNFPGVYSKFMYQALGFDGLMKLVDEGEKATFRAYIAYYDEQLAEEGAEPIIYFGEKSGSITKEFMRDTETEMPYALFFIPEGAEKPLAELSAEERAGDHRQQAVVAFANWYKKNR